LVHPLRCLMPTESAWKLRGRLTMAAALALNGLISFDRNQGLPPEKHLPMGEMLSKKALIQLLGKEFNRPGITGAAVWYDGMAINTERLGFAFLHSGVQRGLAAINYCPVIGFSQDGKKITGVRVHDAVQEKEFTIAADCVVNAAGAWAGKLLHLLPQIARHEMPQVRVMNLIVQRELFPSRQAVGLFNKGRVFFFVPWRDCWMIGTDETAWQGEPDALYIDEQDIGRFLAQINAVYPGTPIRRDEVCHVHKGFVPGCGKPNSDFRLIDHAEDGLENILSIFPVKYTTARDIGQKTIDLYFKKTGRPFVPSQSAQLPLVGGEMPSFAAFVAEKEQEIVAQTGISLKAARHLLQNYGSWYEKVLRYADLLELLPGSDEVLQAEIAYAVDEEMAQAVDDVILRRTGIGAVMPARPETVAACATLMRKRLGRRPLCG
jgi:glycerol-3-phosphate dehydrogenase